MEAAEEDYTLSISRASLGLVSAISTKAMRGEFYSAMGVVKLKTNIKEEDLPVEDIDALKEGIKWVTKLIPSERTIGEITKVEFEVLDGIYRIALTFAERPTPSHIPISKSSSPSPSSISSMHRVQNTVIRKKNANGKGKGKKNNVPTQKELKPE